MGDDDFLGDGQRGSHGQRSSDGESHRAERGDTDRFLRKLLAGILRFGRLLSKVAEEGWELLGFSRRPGRAQRAGNILAVLGILVTVGLYVHQRGETEHEREAARRAREQVRTERERMRDFLSRRLDRAHRIEKELGAELRKVESRLSNLRAEARRLEADTRPYERYFDEADVWGDPEKYLSERREVRERVQAALYQIHREGLSPGRLSPVSAEWEEQVERIDEILHEHRLYNLPRVKLARTSPYGMSELFRSRSLRREFLRKLNQEIENYVRIVALDEEAEERERQRNALAEELKEAREEASLLRDRLAVYSLSIERRSGG